LCYSLLLTIFFIFVLTAALSYLSSQIDLDMSEFDKACGVGVKVTVEDIERCVEKVINKHKEELLAKRLVACSEIASDDTSNESSVSILALIFLQVPVQLFPSNASSKG